jgi:hypothetical protein
VCKPAFSDARVQNSSFVSRIRSDQKNHVRLLNAGHGGIEEVIRAHINAMYGRGVSTGLVKCEVIGTETVNQIFECDHSSGVREMTGQTLNLVALSTRIFKAGRYGRQGIRL